MESIRKVETALRTYPGDINRAVGEYQIWYQNDINKTTEKFTPHQFNSLLFECQQIIKSRDQSAIKYEKRTEMLIEWLRGLILEGKTTFKEAMFSLPSLAASRETLKEELEMRRYKPDIHEGARECKKCHSKQTMSVENQTRSSDEASVSEVLCLSCNNRWRER
jgi:DNA-directed RNA polymerase subunit M/transcription elongation factor TFIIS